MCLQHKIHLISLTETHLNTPELEFKVRNSGAGYIYFNSMMDTRKGMKGTAMMHFLNNFRKRNITNINLIPGILQWFRFESRGIPVNIFTLYLSGRANDKENETQVINSLTNAILTLGEEHVIVSGDLNINTIEPKNDRDKEWIWLLNLLNLREHITNNMTYIRRQNNNIKSSRPDHIFVSRGIRVTKETMLPPITQNDHIPFYLDLEFESHLSWRSYIGKKRRKTMVEEINKTKPITFQDLNTEIRNGISKYGTRVDKLGGSTISSSYKGQIKRIENEINSKLEDPSISLSEILSLQQSLKELHIESSNEIKDKLTEKFNDRFSSNMYQFDRHIHSKEIIWRDLPFQENDILTYFTKKFTSSNQIPTFIPSTSTVKAGPNEIKKITYKELTKAIKRMKSNTPGEDEISLDIIKELSQSKKELILKEFNNCLENGNILQEWKTGWVKLIPKREIKTLGDIRPITILPIFYRILFNIIAFKLRSWASKEINPRQQAFINDRNTLNHGVLLGSLALKTKAKTFILINLDIEGAYDAVEMSVIRMALKHCKFPNSLIEFIINSYSNQSLKLEIDRHLSNSFEKTRGIPQGYPLAPLIYDCITQLVIDKAIDEWKIPILPTELDANDIGLCCFADDMNIVCDKTIDYNLRLNNIDQWLTHLLFKLNPKKSIATLFPMSDTIQLKIKDVQIPIQNNLRILGHYPWEDEMVIKDIEEKISKFKESLKYFPILKIEPRNVKQIIHAKVISLFTHLSKFNVIPPSLIKKIDVEIRKTIRKKLKLDLASKTEFFHLPLEEGGLGIPTVAEFTDRLNLRTLTLLANSNNILVRQAFLFGLKHAKETSKSAYNQWNSLLSEYNLVFKNNRTKFKLEKINNYEHTRFTIHTDGSKLEKQTGIGINIYELGQTTPCRSLSLRINDEYSNNIAEISAILIAMKLLPNNSSVRIETDSKVAMSVLSNNYKGNFLPFKTEFFKTIEENNISYYFIKVEAHVNLENIKVDRLAKEGTKLEKIFDIKCLLTKHHLLTRNNIVIFDCKHLTTKKHLEKMRTNIDSNPNYIPNQTWLSINVAYLKTKIQPENKYNIWRNGTNSHIKYKYKKDAPTPQCTDCECPADLEHYLLECPRLDFQRRYCQDKISELLERTECSLNPIQEIPYLHTRILCIHYSGITFFEEEYMRKIPDQDFTKKWPEIQSLLSLFAGRAWQTYRIDAKPPKPKPKQ